MQPKTPNSMEAALAQALRGSQKAHAGCDAEMTAAYAEGCLKGPERQRFEGHLAECAGCRALATTMLEELAPAGPEPRRARSWLRWSWAVPAMAGVLIVGSAVFYQRREVFQVKAPRAVAVERVALPADPPPPAIAPRAPVLSVGGAPARSSNLRRNQIVPPAERAERGARQEQYAAAAASPAPQLAQSAPAAEKPASLDEERRNTNEARQADKLADAKDDNKKVAGGFAGGYRDAEEGKGKEGKDSAQVSSRLRTQQQVVGMQKQQLPGNAPANAVATRGLRQWAVSNRGQIYRSLDNGQTWTKIPSPTDQDLVTVELESETSLVVGDSAGKRYQVKP